MLRKFARGLLFGLVGLVVLGGILFTFGLRIVLDGGGNIHFAFTKSAQKQAAEIAQHREAQRAQEPAPSAASPAPVETAPLASATTEKPSTAAAKGSTHWTNFRGPDRDGHYQQPYEPTGQARSRRCGSNRSGAVTRHSSSPMAGR